MNDKVVMTLVDADGANASARSIRTSSGSTYQPATLSSINVASGSIPKLQDRYLHDPFGQAMVSDHYEPVPGSLPSDVTITATYWALTDNQGTVTDILDSQGHHAWHGVYDSYGNLVSQTTSSNPPTPMSMTTGLSVGIAGHASGSSGVPGITYSWGYTGESRDSHTGLNYHRARWYAPTTGRFISEDPLGWPGDDQGNLYRYVSNGPMMYVDPTGWCKQNAQPVIQGPSGASGAGGWLGMFGNELAYTFQSGISNAASGLGTFGSAALNWGFDITGHIFNALLGGSVAHAPTLDITPEQMRAYESQHYASQAQGWAMLAGLATMPLGGGLGAAISPLRSSVLSSVVGSGAALRFTENLITQASAGRLSLSELKDETFWGGAGNLVVYGAAKGLTQLPQFTLNTAQAVRNELTLNATIGATPLNANLVAANLHASKSGFGKVVQVMSESDLVTLNSMSKYPSWNPTSLNYIAEANAGMSGIGRAVDMQGNILGAWGGNAALIAESGTATIRQGFALPKAIPTHMIDMDPRVTTKVMVGLTAPINDLGLRGGWTQYQFLNKTDVNYVNLRPLPRTTAIVPADYLNNLIKATTPAPR